MGERRDRIMFSDRYRIEKDGSYKYKVEDTHFRYEPIAKQMTEKQAERLCSKLNYQNNEILRLKAIIKGLQNELIEKK